MVASIVYAAQKKSTLVTPVVATQTASSTFSGQGDMVSEALAAKVVAEAKISTVGWKTCRNEESGYEFKYPADWILGVTKDDDTSPETGTLATCSAKRYVSVASKESHEVPNPPLGEGYFAPSTTTCASSINLTFTPKEKISMWNNDKHTVNDQYIIDVSNFGAGTRVNKVFIVEGKNAFISGGNLDYPCNPLHVVSIAEHDGLLSFMTEYMPDSEFETILSTFHFFDTKNPQP